MRRSGLPSGRNGRMHRLAALRCRARRFDASPGSGLRIVTRHSPRSMGIGGPRLVFPARIEFDRFLPGGPDGEHRREHGSETPCMRIFISAGEPSGDLHAANLIRSIRRRSPGAEFVGYGGAKMAGAGAELLYPLVDLAVMWFLNVLLNAVTFIRLIFKADRYF